MEYLKKYKYLIIVFILVIALVFITLFNKPEVEGSEIVEAIDSQVIDSIKVEIKGAVKKTGVYEVSSDARVVDVLNLSGILKNADTTNINMSAKLMDAMVIDIPYQDEVEIKSIKVDIKGAVKIPGVYSLKENDRVIDVIKLSGGLIDTADTSNINLSKKVFDEMVIIIPVMEENNTQEKLENDAIIGDEQNNNEEKEEINDIENEIKICLNTASLEELMTLSGIGESKALAIIEYRKSKSFESIEEITNVSGIGNSLYEKIKNYITV